MNEVTLQGKIVNVSKLSKSCGDAFITFNVELERSRVLPGEKSETLKAKFYDYPKISAYDDLALKISKELIKGCTVTVKGWVHTCVVKTESFNQYRTEIVADDIEVL